MGSEESCSEQLCETGNRESDLPQDRISVSRDSMFDNRIFTAELVGTAHT